MSDSPPPHPPAPDAIPLAVPVTPAPPRTADDGVATIIPYKNPHALIAYYLGVFSVIPCFPIGLAAFVLGIMGLKKRKANPLLKGSVHAWIGIIVGGFFGLIWLVATVVPIVMALLTGS